MRDAIEPRAPLVVRGYDIPGRMLAVGKLEHEIAGPGKRVQAAKRLDVHGTELPLTEWILDPRCKSLLLFFLADFEPYLDQDNAAVDDVFLDLGA